MFTGGWGSEPDSVCGASRCADSEELAIEVGEISSWQIPPLSFLFKFFIKEKRKCMGRCKPWFSSLEKALSGTVESCS